MDGDSESERESQCSDWSARSWQRVLDSEGLFWQADAESTSISEFSCPSVADLFDVQSLHSSSSEAVDDIPEDAEPVIMERETEPAAAEPAEQPADNDSSVVEPLGPVVVRCETAAEPAEQPADSSGGLLGILLTVMLFSYGAAISQTKPFRSLAFGRFTAPAATELQPTSPLAEANCSLDAACPIHASIWAGEESCLESGLVDVAVWAAADVVGTALLQRLDLDHGAF